jgi:UDP-3-O-[3-hydroxymyristoyl] glucosamine N-acyltransferase
MTITSQDVSAWPVKDGWSISPGTPGCAQGNRVIFGSYVRIDSDVSIGSGVRIDSDVSIGSYVRIDSDVSIGSGVRIDSDVSIGSGVNIDSGVSIGSYVSISSDVSIGSYVSIGSDVSIGSGKFWNFGRETLRGYGRCAYIDKNGQLILQAGCHHFTLVEARTHWGDQAYPDRKRGDEYLALCDYAEALAKINGIKT